MFFAIRESYAKSVGNLLYGWGLMAGLGSTWASYDMNEYEYSGAMGGIALDNGDHMCFNAFHFPWLDRTTVDESLIDETVFNLAFFGALEYNPAATILLDYYPLGMFHWCT